MSFSPLLIVAHNGRPVSNDVAVEVTTLPIAIVSLASVVVRWRVRSFDLVALLTFVVGVASLVGPLQSDAHTAILVYRAAEYLLVLGTLVETWLRYRHTPVRRTFWRNNRPVLVLTGLFGVTFAAVRLSAGLFDTARLPYTPHIVVGMLLLRNLYVLRRAVARLNRLSRFVTRIVLHPAQTIALSFVVVIVLGAGILMMPFAVAPPHPPLGVLDALFTATSAVCVTGLIVVDTATVFSVAGQLVIMSLIQIGGLGFMILSFFTVFLLRRRVSVEDRKVLSYMLSEHSLGSLRRAVRNIVVLTLSIEAVGAALLYPFLSSSSVVPARRLFLAVFHSVSAFCNAGFALFSDSLESFAGNTMVNAVIALLIVGGGLSFGVISNVFPAVATAARGRRSVSKHLSVNSKAVLAVTGILIVGGTLLFYALEHARALSPLSVGAQYRAALFQSITLRTAGFNTINLSALTDSTYLLMIAFMFIGGAAGSTAGGIKINTVAVIAAAMRQRSTGNRRAVLFGHSVNDRQVATAFAVLVFGLVAVGFGAIVLAATEQAPLIHILFETVSAFGTVGLSAGITGSLTVPGRMMIIVLMFVGRVGPLTLLSAFAGEGEAARVEYPETDVLIG